MARILHLIDEFKVGGAQTHLVTMLGELRRSYPFEHEVWALFEEGPIADQIRDLGVPARALAFRPLFQRHRYDLIARRLDREMGAVSPDIVEAHLTWSRLLGLWGAWRAGVPRRIGFEHGDIYLSSWPFRAANFIGQHLAHRLVVCSDALGRWARSTHGIHEDRLAVLHNCVDVHRFHPSKRRNRPETWPEVETLFCAVGTLGAGVNKRMDVCIRAIAEARRNGADVGLVICGDGSQRAGLAKLMADLDVQHAVRILGMRDDVPEVVASCDAFCHAAPFEPFGIVCIEAMASGLPVVVPDSGGISEAVDDGETGWVYSALDAGALADRMARLHRDPRSRERMGAAGRSAAEERFAVPQYVGRLVQLYGIEGEPAAGERIS